MTADSGSTRIGGAAAPVGGEEVDAAVAPGGRRRRNAVDGARELRVVVKLTVAEKAVVTALAAGQGITSPALLMRAVLTGGAEAAAKYQRLRDELTAARRLLASVSNNVNQLARQANTYAIDPRVEPVTSEQVAAALEAVARASARIEMLAAGVAERVSEPVRVAEGTQ